MVIYDGKLKGYPVANPVDPEKVIKMQDAIGYMCLSPSEWQKREEYIFDLEAYGGDGHP